jgi:hypothetical protein
MFHPARRLAYAPYRSTVALQSVCFMLWLAAQARHFVP